MHNKGLTLESLLLPFLSLALSPFPFLTSFSPPPSPSSVPRVPLSRPHLPLLLPLLLLLLAAQAFVSEEGLGTPGAEGDT